MLHFLMENIIPFWFSGELWPRACFRDIYPYADFAFKENTRQPCTWGFSIHSFNLQLGISLRTHMNPNL